MHDLNLVHCLQSSDTLYENLPNLSFFDVSFIFFMVDYFLENITVISQFHYNAINKAVKI